MSGAPPPNEFDVLRDARKFVLASPPPGASPREVRRHLPQRFYGFDPR